MLLLGLVVGRRWVIPFGGLAWVVFVVIAVSIAPGGLPLTAALGAANVAVGVLVRRTAAWIARLLVRVTRLARAA